MLWDPAPTTKSVALERLQELLAQRPDRFAVLREVFRQNGFELSDKRDHLISASRFFTEEIPPVFADGGWDQKWLNLTRNLGLYVGDLIVARHIEQHLYWGVRDVSFRGSSSPPRFVPHLWGFEDPDQFIDPEHMSLGIAYSKARGEPYNDEILYSLLLHSDVQCGSRSLN